MATRKASLLYQFLAIDSLAVVLMFAVPATVASAKKVVPYEKLAPILAAQS